MRDLDLALVDQLPDLRAVADQQRPGVAQYVLAQAAAERARRMAALQVVDEVRERQLAAVLGEQGNEEVLRIEQRADHRMHLAVELLLVDVGGGQLGDMEQCRLQPLGAFAFDDLQLQAAVGLGQFQRALADAVFEARPGSACAPAR